MNFLQIFYPELFLTANVAALLSLVIILTKKWHFRLSNDTIDGPQKFHIGHTPRVGGIAIFLALVAAWNYSPKHIAQLLEPILIAGFPVFVSGVTEDLSKRINPLVRLFAALVTGVAACWLTGYRLSHLDVWGVDYLLTYFPLSVAFTAFAIAGVTNSINIIDGFNGLASGTVAICLFALSLIAWQVGDLPLAQLCFTVIVVIIGFMLFNYPHGKIFLGDGGAYLLGFILAWVAIMLPMRNPQVSVWASLLVCAYPINETIYSMARRLVTKAKLGNPDSSHLHSLIKIKIIRPKFGYIHSNLRNALVAPWCWTFAILFATISIVIPDDTALLMVAWFLSLSLYSIIHARLSRIKVLDITHPNVRNDITVDCIEDSLSPARN